MHKDARLYRMPEAGGTVSVAGRDLEPRGNLVVLHKDFDQEARSKGLTPASRDEVTRWEAQEEENRRQQEATAADRPDEPEPAAGANTPSRTPGPGTAVSPEEARALGMQGSSTGGSQTPSNPPTQPINEDERGGKAGSPNADTQASAAGNPPAGQQAPSGTTDRGANAATEVANREQPTPKPKP
jgi:hypothetical protein